MSTRFIVAAVAAAVVGYVTESPQAAFATFSAVYGVTGFLDPNSKVSGPRLQDLKFPAASYGSPIPYVEGHPRVPGIIAWSIDPKREVATTTTQSGKGGPGVDQTTYSYQVDMRIILSENTGFRPRRCWSNGALIWTAADDATTDSLAASAATTSWTELRVYTGDDTQMPDPTEEAYVGTGLSPAYRGRSSIVIVGLDCGQSGQLPVLTWEISNGTVTTATTTNGILSAPETTDGNDTIATAATLTTANSSLVAYSVDGVTLTRSTLFPSLTYTAAKLNASAYSGQKLTYSVKVKVGATTGSGDGDITRFFTLSNGGDEDSFAFRITSSTTYLYAFRERSGIGGGGTLLGAMPVGTDGYTECQIVYTAAGSVEFYAESALLLSVADTRPSGNPVVLQMTNGAGTCVSEFTAKTLRVYLNDGVDTSYDVVALAEPTHQAALQRQWVRAGLDLSLLDASAASGVLVYAMAVSQLTSPRAVMDNLASQGLYEFYESGDGVKVVLRGGASARTLDYADLGAFSGDSPPDPLPRVRGNELEVTSQVSVKYMNIDDDYRDGTETSTRLATGSSIVTVAEIPLGLTATKAKRLADVAVTDALASIIRIGPVALTRKHADLEPCDVVTLTGKDGSTYRTRITKRTEGSGLITLEGVEDDATVINSAAVTSTNYTSTSAVTAYSVTDATLLDIPILRESDDGRGIYVAAKPTGTKWGGYALLKSPDDIDYTTVSGGANAAVKGICSTVPGNWTGGRTFDETDSIVCDLGSGTVSSTTRAAILADKSVNSFVIGAHGRWLFGQFRDATLQSAGVYKLTGLLLGDRGTEHNIGTQIVGDTIVILNSGGVVRVGQESTDYNTLRYYKAVSNGRSVAGTTSQSITEEEVGLMPFAPVYFRASRSSGDITFTWTRRTRLSTITAGASSPIVPLGEESESWSIDVYTDNTYATVVRTLTSTTTTATYASADQVTDFGSAQSIVYAKVYQISALVGRGIPLQAAA